MSATTIHDVKRQTTKARVECVAELVAAEPDEAWVLWCDTNYESDALQKAIPQAIEIRGSQTLDQKEASLDAFTSGDARYLIAKPSMCGHGLNWQHCARMAFVGRGYSYEAYYQAVRRCWRYGQRRPVEVHLIVAEGENYIGRVIDRKAADHINMKSAMCAAMARDLSKSERQKTSYDPQYLERMPGWLKSSV